MGRQHGRSATWHSRPLAIPSLERGTLADRAADAIRLRILQGSVAPGQRIEPFRELASELGVSLSVAREAVARLKGEGLVEVRPGVGTFVTTSARAARTLKAVRLRAARQEVAELRIAVDPAIARAAAARASDRAMEELHYALGERAFARVGSDPRAFVRADIAFHLAIAKASGNGLGIGMHRLGAKVLQPELAVRAREHARNRELDELHRALFDAIDAGRALQAERAARRIAAIEAMPP